MRLTSILAFVVSSLLASSSARTALAQPLGGGSLDAALATVSADEIRADIFFIASDELEGRDTISGGQRIAARFIRSRLERLGVRPGGPGGGYFFEYPLYTQRLREKESYARFDAGDTKVELALGRDYYFSSGAPRDLELVGGIVFCGAGGKGELAKAQLEGKWALVLDDGGLVGDLERALVDAKALGALMTPAASFRGKDYAEKFSRSLQSFTRGSARWPTKDNEKTGSSAPAFLYVQRGAVQRWLPELAAGNENLPAVGTQLAGSFAHKRVFQGDNGKVMAENVCGFWPGNDANLAREVIIISAHYDHVGYSGGTEIHNGADDNGSGTCGLLALAEALSVHGPLKRSVMLMWVSGEEKGLWGSKAWTENPYLPEGHKAICDINIDMIGRNAPDYLLITPTSKRAEYNGLVKIAEKVAPLEGFPTLGSCDAYWSRSDHANFAQNLKIPVAFLFSAVHEDYHKPSDDPEKIDCDKIRRVVRTVMRMIDGLQETELKL